MDQKENGLQLLHKRIQRINGPVSMYYLKPKKNVWNIQKREGLELPLLLLWGDIHQYRTGMCENCSCDIDNESKNNCCIPLHDKIFLKELDEIAKFTPIDFYTEFAKDMISYIGKDEDILFGDFIKATTMSCHDVSLRSKNIYKKLCPTKYIRWHYIDARFMKDVIEGHIINPIPLWINFQIRRLSKNPFASFPSTLGDVLMEYDEYDPYYPSEFLSYSIPINISIISLFFDSENIEILTKSFIDQVFDALAFYRPKRKSGIFKQLDRIAFYKLTDIDVWKDLIISNLIDMPIYHDAFISFINIPKDIRKNLYDFIIPNISYDLTNNSSSNSKNRKQISYVSLIPALEALNKLIIIAQTKIMDLYFIGRLLKSPKENITGTLALGFFGDYHTRSIVDLLSKPIFGYDVVTIQSTDLVEYNDPRINRCISIKTPISLIQDIQIHHKQRFPNINNQWRLGIYHKQINKEQQQRNENEKKMEEKLKKRKKEEEERLHKQQLNKRKNTGSNTIVKIGGKYNSTRLNCYKRYTRSKKKNFTNKNIHI
jgi:hypothetical protein